MKLSVSLTPDDVATLDAYARDAGLPSRSAALQHAVRMLRHPHLEHEYAKAWAEWGAGDAEEWETVTADGIADAPR